MWVNKESQHGFVKGTNLLKFFNEVTDTDVEDNAINMVNMDFQEALDKLLHNRLRNKVMTRGMKGTVTTLTQNCLGDRKHTKYWLLDVVGFLRSWC